MKISANDDAQTIVLGRMASVSITAVRKATTVDLGACAVIFGLGLVGNFAAQLLQLAGMKVLGLDPVEGRVAMAQATGLAATVAIGGNERATVESVLGGGGDLVVEASGVPDAVPTAIAVASNGGEVVLLGSPRGLYSGDANGPVVRDPFTRHPLDRSAGMVTPSRLGPMASSLVPSGRLRHPVRPLAPRTAQDDRADNPCRAPGPSPGDLFATG